MLFNSLYTIIGRCDIHNDIQNPNNFSTLDENHPLFFANITYDSHGNWIGEGGKYLSFVVLPIYFRIHTFLPLICLCNANRSILCKYIFTIFLTTFLILVQTHYFCSTLFLHTNIFRRMSDTHVLHAEFIEVYRK